MNQNNWISWSKLMNWVTELMTHLLNCNFMFDWKWSRNVQEMINNEWNVTVYLKIVRDILTHCSYDNGVKNTQRYIYIYKKKTKLMKYFTTFLCVKYFNILLETIVNGTWRVKFTLTILKKKYTCVRLTKYVWNDMRVSKYWH